MTDRPHPTSQTHDPEKPAQYAIAQLGGVSVFAKETSIPVSTAWDWWNRGHFPARYRGRNTVEIVLEVAARLEAELTAQDCVLPRSAA